MNARRDFRTIPVRLPADLSDAVKAVAAQKGEAEAVVIRAVLREALETSGALPAITVPRPTARAA